MRHSGLKQGCGLQVLVQEKSQFVSFDLSHNSGPIDVNLHRFVLDENNFSRYQYYLSYLNWNWGFALSVAKIALKKIETLIFSFNFMLFEVAFYLYESTMWPCVEYCCHVWTGTCSRYFHHSSVTILRCYMGVHANSFLLRTIIHSYSSSAEYFLLHTA